MNESSPGPDALAALLQTLYGAPAVEENLRRDREFAQTLRSLDLVSGESLDECLEEQERSARAGTRPVPRLRRLLIQKGILTPTQVAEAAESADVPPPGRLGPYQCIEKLGSGGMGQVWKAWDTVLERPVALKLLKAEDPEELARFRREAELSAKLVHPHIAAIYGFGSEGGRPYLAMQYVEGKTFDQFPRTDRNLLVRFVRDAARAVEYAHRQGIVHRDLKPSNFMVGHDQVFVLDFGLARRIEGDEKVTAPGIILGTPAYMSPEQARGAEVDARSDVYGLGATLYEILANSPPFQGPHVIDVLRRVENEDPRMDRTVDKDLQAVVLKCLEKDPARRYPSAGALADDLDRFLKGEPVTARAPGAAYRLWKWLGKRKALVAVAAVAILLGGAAAFLGRRAWSAEVNALAGLRRQTHTALLAVLEVRRSGRTEHMKPFVDRTEEACREAMRLLPRSAEPHYRLGRMYRAVMEDERALEEQDRAIGKEPDYGPALYERGVLLSRKYRNRVEELVQAALIAEGRRLAGGGEVKPGSDVRRPDGRQLAERDGRAKALMERMTADLGKMEDRAGELTDGEKSCARGLMAWALRKDEEAVKFLAVAVAAEPGLEEGTEALATQHSDQGRYRESILAWSAGRERDLGYVPHLMGRGGVRLRWGNDLIVRGEDPSSLYFEAIKDFGEALDRSPSHVEAWRWRGAARLNLATCLEHFGKDPVNLFQEGIRDFEQALKLDADRAVLWRGRGVSRLNLGTYLARRGGDPAEQFGGAIEDLGEALRRDPEDPEAWVGRGFARSNAATYKFRRGEDPTGTYREAIADYGEALKLNPESTEAWEGRGFARLNSGSYTMGRGEDPSTLYGKAIEEFEESLRRKGGSAQAWLGRGGARANWGIYKQDRGEDPTPLWRMAIEDYAEVLKRNPGHELGWKWRGDVRLNWGHYVGRRLAGDPAEWYRGAIEDYGESLKLNVANVEAWEALAGTHYYWGLFKAGHGEDPAAQCDEAIRSISRAIAIRRSEAAYWRSLGYAQRLKAAYRARQKLDAGAEYRTALESYREAVRLNGRLEAELRPYIEECLRFAAPTEY